MANSKGFNAFQIRYMRLKFKPDIVTIARTFSGLNKNKK